MQISIPTNEHDIIKALRIYRSPRVGPRSYFKLLAGAQNFDEAIERLEYVARHNNIKGYQIATADSIRREIESGATFGAQLIFYGSADYPEQLAQTENAPPFLWVKGKSSLLNTLQIGIVGSRNASIEGIRVTHQLSRAIGAEGVVVTSGLARGIDTAAHEGALATGTIAVLAGGLDIFAPRENRELQENICAHGAVISEMPFGHEPQAANFPQRNRIIAGLVHAILVPEGGLRSGSAITANDAADLGRDLLAVPGHPFHGLAALPNQLIADGATMIRNTGDISRYLDLTRGSPLAKAKPPVGSTALSPKFGAPTLMRRTVDASKILQKIGQQVVENAGENKSRFLMR